MTGRRTFLAQLAGVLTGLLGFRMKPKTKWIGIHKVMEQEWPMQVVKKSRAELVELYPASLDGLFKQIYMGTLNEAVPRFTVLDGEGE